jgi:TolB-like protein
MQTTEIVRFGVFALDLRSGELYKNGLKIKLQEKPFQLLKALLECPGKPVTKEELRDRLWPTGIFVDFDSSLKIAASKLRGALCDSAKNPRFIETLARRGYRFIAPVGSRTPLHTAAAPRSEKSRVAVLPFRNLSGDPGQEFLSGGLTEEIISQLGSLSSRQLAVIARASAVKYRGTEKGIAEIAVELGADYLIEGSTLAIDRRVRITAGLIQGSNQTYLWAKSYEHDLTDVLALQRRVAADMVKEIQIVLDPRAASPVSHSPSRAAA